MQFGDWLNLGRMKDSWYLVCVTADDQFKNRLKEALGKKAAVNPVTEYLFHIESTMNRAAFEKTVASLTGEQDSAAVIYPTSKGLKHKEIR